MRFVHSNLVSACTELVEVREKENFLAQICMLIRALAAIFVERTLKTY